MLFTIKMGAEMDYVVVADTKEETVSALSETGAIQRFPYSFLIDRSGKIAWHGNSKFLPDAVDARFLFVEGVGS